MTWKYKLRVTINNDSLGKFYTGSIVTGLVTLELKQDLKIKCVNLEVFGKSKASWTRASPTVPYIRIYSEKKKILYVKLNNIFSEAIEQDSLIPAGIYNHPFHFALPHDLPSTFKSSISSVNYYIKISSNPPYTLTKNVPFVVISNVNLNNIDGMLIPCAYVFKRYFRSTATNLKVHLKTYKGFAPGQIIPIEIKLLNENKIKVKKIRILLVQKIHYSMMMEVIMSCHQNLIESIPVTVAVVPVIHDTFES